MTPVANLPAVATTPAENFATNFASVVVTVGKFVTDVNNTCGKASVINTSGNDTGGTISGC
jgi:hypothetical protein